MVCALCRTIVEPQSAQMTRPEYLLSSSIFVGRFRFCRTRWTISQTSRVISAGWVPSNTKHSSLGCCIYRLSL